MRWIFSFSQQFFLNARILWLCLERMSATGHDHKAFEPAQAFNYSTVPRITFTAFRLALGNPPHTDKLPLFASSLTPASLPHSCPFSLLVRSEHRKRRAATTRPPLLPSRLIEESLHFSSQVDQRCVGIARSASHSTPSASHAGFNYGLCQIVRFGSGSCRPPQIPAAAGPAGRQNRRTDGRPPGPSPPWDWPASGGC